MADIKPSGPPGENEPVAEHIAYWLKQIGAALAGIDNKIDILVKRTAATSLAQVHRHPRQKD